MFLEGGTAADGIRYPGKTYSDGCGNPISYKAAAAIYSLDRNGKDVHIKTPGHLHWKDMKVMIDSGWSIENHGFGGPYIADRWLELHTQTKYIYDNIKHQGREIRTRVFVVPGNSPGYIDAAFNTQHKIATSQSTFDGYQTQHPVSVISDFDLDKLMLQRRFLEKISYKKADEWIDELFEKVNDNKKSVLRAFSHNIQLSPGSFGLIKHVFDRIDSLSNDRIWVTTVQDLYEYLETKRDVVKSEKMIGNKLIVELDLSNIDDLNRFRDMSLVVEADSKIRNIHVHNADQSSFNIHSGLINIFVENTSFPDPIFDNAPPLLVDAMVKFKDAKNVHLLFDQSIQQSQFEAYSISGKTITDLRGSEKKWVLTVDENIEKSEKLKLNYIMKKGNAVDSQNPQVAVNSYFDLPIRNRLDVKPDTIAPTTPKNFRARKLTSNGYELIWRSSTDNEAVKGYYLEINGKWNKILNQDTSFYFFNDPEMVTTFRVKSVDTNHNFSPTSPYLKARALSLNEYQVQKTIMVTFGGSAKNNDFGWNVLTKGVREIGESYKLRETNGYILTHETPITISTLTQFENISGSEPSSGDNSGLFPDGVVNSIWRTAKTEGENPYLRINNLSREKYYNIYILGNVSGDDTEVTFTVDGEAQKKVISKNFPKRTPVEDAPWLSPSLLHFEGKKADENGHIYIEMKKNSGSWVGINAMVIEETNLKLK